MSFWFMLIPGDNVRPWWREGPGPVVCPSICRRYRMNPTRPVTLCFSSTFPKVVGRFLAFCAATEFHLFCYDVNKTCCACREMVAGRLPFAGQNMEMYLANVCGVSYHPNSFHPNTIAVIVANCEFERAEKRHFFACLSVHCCIVSSQVVFVCVCVRVLPFYPCDRERNTKMHR